MHSQAKHSQAKHSQALSAALAEGRVAARRLLPVAGICVGLGVPYALILSAFPNAMANMLGEAPPGSVAVAAGALWGGVALSTVPLEEKVFSLARPVGRLAGVMIQVAVLVALLGLAWLLVQILSYGVVTADLFGSAGTRYMPLKQLSLPSVYVVVPYAIACGLLAGALLEDTSTALGLALTLAVGGVFIPPWLWTIVSNPGYTHPDDELRRTLLWTDALPGVPLGGLLLGAPALWYHLRWSPIRSWRALLPVGLLMLSTMTVGAVLVFGVLVEPVSSQAEKERP